MKLGQKLWARSACCSGTSLKTVTQKQKGARLALFLPLHEAPPKSLSFPFGRDPLPPRGSSELSIRNEPANPPYTIYLSPAFLILKVITVPETGRLRPAGTGNEDVQECGEMALRSDNFFKAAFQKPPLAQPLTRGTQTEEAEKSQQRKAKARSEKQACSLSPPHPPGPPQVSTVRRFWKAGLSPAPARHG